MNDWLDYIGSGSTKAYAANGMMSDTSLAHAYQSRDAANAKDLKNKLDKYNNQLRELTAARDRLNSDISNWESTRKGAAAKGYALKASQVYEPKIAAARKKIKELETKITMTKQTIANLNNQMDANTRAYDEAYVSNNQANVEKLRRQYDKYESQLDELRSARSATQSEIDRLEGNRKGAAAKGYALKASQVYEPKITAARKKLKDIETKISMTKQSLSNIKNQMNIASTRRR